MILGHLLHKVIEIFRKIFELFFLMGNAVVMFLGGVRFWAKHYIRLIANRFTT